jgi:ABC-2 type transport system ATP-binding protein
VLELQDLRRRFDDIVALDGLSFSAAPGRLLGFLGPNGAGKTTAMRSIFGIVRPDSGTIRWQGQEITRTTRLRFGYMPEQRGLYPKMGCADQLTYFARTRGIEAGAARAASLEWLERLGLGERADDAVEALSHGNQQRVQLAAALVHGPELLVLDEPFSGLDPLGVTSMEAVLREEAEAGRTIIFSSHQLDLVEALCDDVVIVHEGRHVLGGTIDELRAASDRRRLEVRFALDAVDWTPELAQPLELESRNGAFRALVDSSIDPDTLLASARGAGEVRSFSWTPPSLSELFVEAVGGAVAREEVMG